MKLYLEFAKLAINAYSYLVKGYPAVQVIPLLAFHAERRGLYHFLNLNDKHFDDKSP